MSRQHWAFDLIGKPWSPSGSGPTDFYCWGLLRFAFARERGINMPEIFGDEPGDHLIREASDASGWKPAIGPAQDWDILTMRNMRGERHVALAVQANRSVQVLHSSGCLDRRGQPTGSVVLMTLRDLQDEYRGIEIWRQAPA